MRSRCSLILCALAFLSSSAGAQEPSASPYAEGRIFISLDPEDKTMWVRARKNSKIEKTEDGGLRITYTNPENTKGWIEIGKTFDPPVEMGKMTFELAVPTNERPFIGFRNAKNQMANASLQSYGNMLSPYEVIFTDTKARNADGTFEPFVGPITRVSISVNVVPTDEEMVIELRNWVLEPL